MSTPKRQKSHEKTPLKVPLESPSRDQKEDFILDVVVHPPVIQDHVHSEQSAAWYTNVSGHLGTHPELVKIQEATTIHPGFPGVTMLGDGPLLPVPRFPVKYAIRFRGVVYTTETLLVMESSQFNDVYNQIVNRLEFMDLPQTSIVLGIMNGARLERQINLLFQMLNIQSSLATATTASASKTK